MACRGFLFFTSHFGCQEAHFWCQWPVIPTRSHTLFPHTWGNLVTDPPPWVHPFISFSVPTEVPTLALQDKPNKEFLVIMESDLFLLNPPPPYPFSFLPHSAPPEGDPVLWGGNPLPHNPQPCLPPLDKICPSYPLQVLRDWPRVLTAGKGPPLTSRTSCPFGLTDLQMTSGDSLFSTCHFLWPIFVIRRPIIPLFLRILRP